MYHSARFDKELRKFDSIFKEEVDKIEEHLKENPYVGDPLNVKWFREKRIGKYRVYYLIYEDLKAVYIITISGKKDQQKAINTIRHFLDKYRGEIEDLVT